MLIRAQHQVASLVMHLEMLEFHYILHSIWIEVEIWTAQHIEIKMKTSQQ